MGSGHSFAMVATAKWYKEGSALYGAKGYQSAAKTFNSSDMPPNALAGKVVAVTGSNQGIGYEAALDCAKLGAHVYLLCRNSERAEAAMNSIREAASTDKVDFEIVDVSDFKAVRQFAVDFTSKLSSRSQVLDVLVNNAGMMPATRTKVDGNTKEAIAASTYGGCMLLSALLAPALASSGAGRIINVSSGGAYTVVARTHDLDLEDTTYDGRLFYAVAKRNQLIVTELMNKRFEEKYGRGVLTVDAMHPGWADTTAVREAMPDFHKQNAAMLRSAKEGADTITFLAAAPPGALRRQEVVGACEGERTSKKDDDASPKYVGGQFWFDRRVVPMALSWTGTTPDDATKAKVWKTVLEYCGGNMPSVE